MQNAVAKLRLPWLGHVMVSSLTHFLPQRPPSRPHPTHAHLPRGSLQPASSWGVLHTWLPQSSTLMLLRYDIMARLPPKVKTYSDIGRISGWVRGERG
jgi:hypothetical protein